MTDEHDDSMYFNVVEGDDAPVCQKGREVTEKDKYLRILDSMYVQIAVLLLVIVDVSLLIAELADTSAFESGTITIITFIILVLLSAEVAVRFWLVGWEQFKADWWNFFDIFILVLSFIVLFVFTEGGFIVFGRLFRAFARVFRVARGFHKTQKALPNATRNIVTQNKMRYKQDGFDLDLCYLLDRVIVMSFPAEKAKEKLYRNNIKEVARFFDTKHPEHYQIVNTCKHKSYSKEPFHGRVVKFGIEDHNVPTLQLMLDFAVWATGWLADDPKNVMAIHCKGGKGRTGTMACSYLLYAKVCKDADSALIFFGQQRTDSSKGKKIQGVETSSQRRYVHYLDQALKTYGYKADMVVPKPAYRVKAVDVYVNPAFTSEELDLGKEWVDFRISLRTAMNTQQSTYKQFVLRPSEAAVTAERHVVYDRCTEEPHCQGDTRLELMATHLRESEALFIAGVWFHTGMEAPAADGTLTLTYDKEVIDRNRHLPPGIKNPFTKFKDLSISIALVPVEV
eukprot:GCRY01005287.1.p1 GENE.GCRY01005287.1~~GCRY01005287.1.p1  ORF type:complete len:509 (-),score=120.34 GCRY01005287.1:358-1884(-)